MDASLCRVDLHGAAPALSCRERANRHAVTEGRDARRGAPGDWVSDGWVHHQRDSDPQADPFSGRGQPLSRTELYDLAADPAELEDLSRTRQVAGGYFLSSLQAAVLDRPVCLETSEAVLDEELADRLRAMGYIR